MKIRQVIILVFILCPLTYYFALVSYRKNDEKEVDKDTEQLKIEAQEFDREYEFQKKKECSEMDILPDLQAFNSHNKYYIEEIFYSKIANTCIAILQVWDEFGNEDNRIYDILRKTSIASYADCGPIPTTEEYLELHEYCVKINDNRYNRFQRELYRLKGEEYPF